MLSEVGMVRDDSRYLTIQQYGIICKYWYDKLMIGKDAFALLKLLQLIYIYSRGARADDRRQVKNADIVFHGKRANGGTYICDYDSVEIKARFTKEDNGRHGQRKCLSRSIYVTDEFHAAFQCNPFEIFKLYDSKRPERAKSTESVFFNCEKSDVIYVCFYFYFILFLIVYFLFFMVCDLG